MRRKEFIAELKTYEKSRNYVVFDPTQEHNNRLNLDPGLTCDVLTEPGSPLDKSIRRRMEKAFSTDFSGVVVHDSPRSHKLTRQARVNALTIGSHIFFSASNYNPSSTLGQLILAHELAHVVQKSLGTRQTGRTRLPVNPALLEAEAVLASLHVLEHNTSPPLSSDQMNEAPRAWGKEGHYFTVLLIARLAGLPIADALALAFYAQLPDQVTDLDAIVAGKAWVQTVVVRTILPVTGRLITKPLQPHVDVQAALHCLNGNLASAETRFRSEVLEKQSFNAPFRFEYGLALHAFGDSFAHRDNDSDAAKMFIYPYGHLGKHPQNFHPEDLMGLGEAIDNINRRGELYKQYGSDMYRLLFGRIGKQSPSAISVGDVEKTLVEISSKPTGAAQIDYIKEQLRLAGIVDTYNPEDDPMTWDKFSMLHAKYLLPDMKERAVRWIIKMSGQSI